MELQPPACWKLAGRSHVAVRALWDGSHTHDDFGPPMYELWRRGLFLTVEVLIMTRFRLEALGLK